MHQVITQDTRLSLSSVMTASPQNVFTAEEVRRRAYLRVARVMYEMWEEKGSSDTRLLLEPLVPTTFVLAGESLAGTDHGEHVVPRVTICEICHAGFAEGGTPEGAATVIERLLKIVRISEEERVLIDHKFGWKMKMPPGWDPLTGSPYARLDQAAIKYRLY